MSKKLVVFILILSMSLMILTSCGKGGDSSTATESTQVADSNAGDKTAGDNVSDESGDSSADEAAEAGGLPPMTTDEITLTYACWGLHEKGEIEARDKQLAAFMEAYPNIKVEFIEIDQSSWNEALYNRAATGTLPDVFWVFSVTEAVKNQWALDVTDMFNADPDTQMIYEGIREVSQINGRRFHVPSVMFPHMVFMNKTLFEKYNVPLPDYDWTFDEYKELAVKLSHPEEYYFGTSNPIYYDFFDAWYDGTSRYGWDGENFNIGQHWVDAWNLRLDWIDQKVIEWMSAEEKEKVLGDPTAWPPGKGRTAMHIDWPWTVAMFEDVVSAETGCEFVYYPLPMGPSGKEMAIIDNSVISATTEHPREAWELQKWTSWGVEACKNRYEGYMEAGAPVSRLPVINNEEVWQQIIDGAPEKMKGFYEHLLKVDITPSPWPIAPGWNEFEAWLAEQDIIGKIERREIRPEDVAEELNQKINEFKQQWLDSTDLDY